MSRDSGPTCHSATVLLRVTRPTSEHTVVPLACGLGQALSFTELHCDGPGKIENMF